MPTDPFVILGFEKPSRAAFEGRFWSKVDRGGDCWLWTANKLPHGYGAFAVARNQMRLAHRVAYILANGDIDASVCVLHACDNPSCVNPAHLRAGTHKDNTQDMLAKGRHAHGERHGNRVLTEPEVLEMRRRYAGGETLTAIARSMGRNVPTVLKIVKRKRWVHI